MCVWMLVAVCVMSVVAAEEVDPSLEWAPRSLLAGQRLPEADLELEGEEEEVRVAKRQAGAAAGEEGLDWQLMLEDGGGEARTRVKRGQMWLKYISDIEEKAYCQLHTSQMEWLKMKSPFSTNLELNADEDRGDVEAMEEESANDGGFDVSGDGDGVEEGQAEWVERRESPQLSSLSGSSPGGEGKEEKDAGDEEEGEVALDKNDAKPPK